MDKSGVINEHAKPTAGTVRPKFANPTVTRLSFYRHGEMCKEGAELRRFITPKLYLLFLSQSLSPKQYNHVIHLTRLYHCGVATIATHSPHS
ncbi:hypothetical protein J6590_071065 [Homalodisca vitripennis]|nr:hypothetical protein J6590_071065 [Homalodisca vitripennis]